MPGQGSDLKSPWMQTQFGGGNWPLLTTAVPSGQSAVLWQDWFWSSTGISGQASATVGVTVTATGVVAVQGQAGATIGVTPTAAGVVAVQGQGAAGIGITPAAVGVVLVQGTASAAISATLAATGTVVGAGGPVQGQGSATVAMISAANGVVLIAGQSSQTLTITLIAGGIQAGQVTAPTQTSPEVIRTSTQRVIPHPGQIRSRHRTF